MLSIGRPDNGARWLIDSSLKFIVVDVFVNGKMAVSLTLSMPMPRFLTVYIVAYRVVYTSASLCFLITKSLLTQYSDETL